LENCQLRSEFLVDCYREKGLERYGVFHEDYKLFSSSLSRIVAGTEVLIFEYLADDKILENRKSYAIECTGY